MQNKNKLWTIALASFLLTGCGGETKDKEHEHTYSSEWSSSNSDHFHKCTVKDCNSVKDSAAHTFGDWEITKNVTADEDGIKKRTCTVCNYEDVAYISSEEYHEHAFSNKYGYDATNHWKVCNVEGCDEKDNTTVAAHQFGSGFSFGGFGGGSNDGWTTSVEATSTSEGEERRTCNTCGYVEKRTIPMIHEHTFNSSVWSKDASGHWHPATCEHTSQKGSESGHVYGAYVVKKEATETEEGSKEASCTVCGYVNTVSIPAKGVESSSFTFNSDITVPQKIHTTNQDNFLKFTGEYYNITSAQLNSYNATGTAENSFPNQVTLTWNYTAPSGKTVKNFSVVTGQTPTLEDGYTIKGTTAKSISFYNPFIGTNYFKVIANFTDNNYEASPIKTFLVEDVAPRNVKIGNMSNCRDMGGRTTVSGGRVKQGLIYRTSDPSGNVTDEVKEEMLNRFKVKTEIYVKDGGGSSSPLGSSVKYFNASMDYGATPYSNFSRNAERLRYVFSVLGNPANYPTFYHCRIGTDRTGICGVTINGLLGVSFNETIQDYSFSNFGKIDGQRYAHKTPDDNGDDAAKYIDEILAMPGNNFQEKTINALLSIGVPAQTLQNVIDILTEGPKITIPTTTTVVKGNDLTNNGGTKKTASDYKNPDVYYEISGSSKSVSTKYNMTEAGKVTVVAYLGCTNSSDSTKLASGIDLKIDGVSKSIVDKTYFKAGFGRTKQASRTGYMFNILGEYDLGVGEHTITIAGKNSDTFNIGTITLIGNGTYVSNGGNTSGGGSGDSGNTGGNQDTDSSVVLSISEASGFNTSSEKMTTNAVSTWTVSESKLPAGTYKVEIEFKSSNSGHSSRTLMEDSNNPLYLLTIGGSDYSPEDKTSTRQALGISSSSFAYASYGNATIGSGEKTIVLKYIGTGYSMMVKSIKFTPIA